MDKRRHIRMEIPNLQVDVSDGVGFFSGTVTDISRFGLSLDDISSKINDQANNLSVVVSAKGRSFKMMATSKWVDEGDYKKRMGIKILDASWDWTEFVMECEPLEDGRFALAAN